MISRARYKGHKAFIPYVVNRLADRLNIDFQSALRERGMTLTHWRVLAFLEETGGLGVSELADCTVTDQSTLSRALQKMERLGLAERRMRPEDNRGLRVHITPRGRTLFAAILPVALALHDRALAGLSAGEHKLLLDLLGRVLANLQSPAESAKGTRGS